MKLPPFGDLDGCAQQLAYRFGEGFSRVAAIHQHVCDFRQGISIERKRFCRKFSLEGCSAMLLH